jgi:hypothetical protein
VCLAPEAVRLVLGAQPGQIGADLRTSDLGDVLVAGALNPFGKGVDIGTDGAGAEPFRLLGDGEPVEGLAEGEGAWAGGVGGCARRTLEIGRTR